MVRKRTRKALSILLAGTLFFSSSGFSGLTLVDVYAATHTATATFYLDGEEVGTEEISVDDGDVLSASSFSSTDTYSEFISGTQFESGTYSYTESTKTTTEEDDVEFASRTDSYSLYQNVSNNQGGRPGQNNTSSTATTLYYLTELENDLTSGDTYTYTINYSYLWDSTVFSIVVADNSSGTNAVAISSTFSVTSDNWEDGKDYTGTITLTNSYSSGKYIGVKVALGSSDSNTGDSNKTYLNSFKLTGTLTTTTTTETPVEGDFESEDDSLTVSENAGDYTLVYNYSAETATATAKYYLDGKYLGSSYDEALEVGVGKSATFTQPDVVKYADFSYYLQGSDTEKETEYNDTFTVDEEGLTVYYYYTSHYYDVTVNYYMIQDDEAKLIEDSTEEFTVAGGKSIKLSIPESAENAKFAYYTIDDGEEITEYTTSIVITGENAVDDQTVINYYFDAEYLVELVNSHFELNSIYAWDLSIPNTEDSGYTFKQYGYMSADETVEVLAMWNNESDDNTYSLTYDIEDLEPGTYLASIEVYGVLTNESTFEAIGAATTESAAINPEGWDENYENWECETITFTVTETGTVTLSLSGTMSSYDWLQVAGITVYKKNSPISAKEDKAEEYEMFYFDSTLYDYDIDTYNSAADAAAEEASDGNTETTEVAIASASATSLTNGGSVDGTSGSYNYSYFLMTAMSNTLSSATTATYSYTVTYSSVWQTAYIYLYIAKDSSGTDAQKVATVGTVSSYTSTTTTKTGTLDLSDVSDLEDYKYIGIRMERSGQEWIGADGTVSFDITGTVTTTITTQPIYMIDSSWIQAGATVNSDGSVDGTIKDADGTATGTLNLQPWNIYTGWDLTGSTITEKDTSSVYAGLAKDTLDEDGNIEFNYPEGGLFNKDSSVKEIYTSVAIPYYKDGSYYTFDSDLYDVYWEGDGTPSSDSTLEYNFDKKIMGSESIGYEFKGFFPFDGEYDTQADYNFGMHTNLQFYLTADGTLDTDDMKFDFSGDDDVWVYVDGQLVLDIGGIHTRIEASIDFATQTASVDGETTDFSEALISALSYDEETGYDTTEVHTLDVFYLERGQGQSNARIKFNLIPINTLTVEKQVSDGLLDTDSIDEDTEFTFHVEKQSEDGSWVNVLQNLTYTLIDASENSSTATTDEDGMFKLKNGEKAVFIAASSGLEDGDIIRAVEDTSGDDYDYATSWEGTDGYTSSYTYGTYSNEKDVVLSAETGKTTVKIENSSFNATILSPWTETFVDSATFTAGIVYSYDEETNDGRNYYFEIANSGSKKAESGELERTIDNLTDGIPYTVTINVKSSGLGNTGLTFTANDVSTSIVAYEADEWETYQLDDVYAEDGVIYLSVSGEVAAGYTVGIDDLTITADTAEDAEANSYEYICYNILNMDLVDDAVIIDYGKSVSVNVLENDTIENESDRYISRTDVVDSAEKSLGLSSKRTKYGRYSYSTDTITYTPNKYVNAIERIQYGAGSTTEAVSAKLSIIPATTVYYEDDFGTSADSKSGIVYTGNWSTVGTSTTTSTSQDADIVGSDDANNYGYDSSYANDAALSAGMAHVVEGEGKDTTATFTFNGTGFDIISRTNADTGMITVRVYSGSNTSGTKVATLPVITTYYAGDLYQIPVINWTAEEYGTYTVEIMVNASNIFCKNTTFYLDAIKIYNPINPNGTDAEEALNAYKADSEAYGSIKEFRDLLIDASTLTGNDDTANGIAFVDSCVKASDASGENVYVQYDTQLSKYNQIGPNNEVYLAQGDAIGFGFINNDTAEIASIQIGARAPSGSTKLEVVNVTKGTTQTIEINSAKDMYYDVTELYTSGDEDVFMILNGSDDENILSLTNIKVTYKSETTTDSPYGFAVSADIGEEIQTTLSDILNGTFDIDDNESEDEAVFDETTNSITLPDGFDSADLPDVTKEGYVFAGWYLDPDYSTIFDSNKTIEGSYTLYARWIDENVLTVKVQTVTGTTTESDKATLRFISTVDTLGYAQAGFVISYKVNEKEYNNAVAVTNVYTSIKAGSTTALPGVFSTESKYFTAYTLRNIPNANFDTEITVTPYIVNEVGVTIYGTQRTVTVNELVANN